MNQQVKEKWLGALRSGHFNQCNGQLHRVREDEDPSFCCLGVLCDLYRQETGKGLWVGEVFYVVIPGWNDIDECFLPLAVQKWAGLDEPDPSFVEDDGDITLSFLNDNGRSFNDIADVIEQHF